MGIGTSLGAYFENSFDHQAGIITPPATNDDNTYSPEGITHDSTPVEVKDKMPFPDNRNPDLDFNSRFGKLPPSGILNDLKKPAGETVPLVRKISDEIKPYSLNPMLDAENGTLSMGGGESVKSAALKYKEEIFEGQNHGFALGNVIDKYPNLDLKTWNKVIKEGFTTDKGRFVSREEAFDLANKQKQIQQKVLDSIPKNQTDNMLLSEDLHQNIIGDYLFGKSPLVDSVPKDRQYPSTSEAQEARTKGLDIQERANIVNKNINGLYTNEVIKAVHNSPSIPTEYKPYVADRIARATIAANRNPLALLGFDPTRINIDPSMVPRTVGGIYDQKTDQAYVNFANQTGSTLIHESIHRGITNLVKDNPEAKKLVDSIGSQEMVVRHIMKTEMGDTESGGGADADRQIAQAKVIFSNKHNQESYKKLLEIAAEAVKDRHMKVQ